MFECNLISCNCNYDPAQIHVMVTIVIRKYVVNQSKIQFDNLSDFGTCYKKL